MTSTIHGLTGALTGIVFFVLMTIFFGWFMGIDNILGTHILIFALIGGVLGAVRNIYAYKSGILYGGEDKAGKYDKIIDKVEGHEDE